MQIEFQEPAMYGNGFVAKKGTVIDASTRPADQVKRWLDRGLVKEVAASNGAKKESENPKRTATTGGNRRKATK
jgi:hypothetical protein